MTIYQWCVAAVAFAFSGSTLLCLCMAIVEDVKYDSPEGASVFFAGVAMFGLASVVLWQEVLR